MALFAAQAVIAIEHARLHEARDRALAEAEAARRRAAFLAEASAALASSLDYDATLERSPGWPCRARRLSARSSC